MDLSIQALVLGIVQGLTEFLPISSSGHLIVVPRLFGWNDPFIDSLEFTVVLHMGTLVALLIYFARDWVRLLLAGLASIRDRSLAGDADRKLAWLIVVTAIPAGIIGALLNDFFEEKVREPALVAIMLVIGAAILWLADRWGAKVRDMLSITFPAAFGIGCAQVLALVPGISRSGITISAGMFLGLTRESAARFSFLISMPVIAGAGIFEARKLLNHSPNAPNPQAHLVVIGFVAALVAGLIAIKALLEFLRRRPLTVFVVYRVVLAAIVLLAIFGLPGTR